MLKWASEEGRPCRSRRAARDHHRRAIPVPASASARRSLVACLGRVGAGAFRPVARGRGDDRRRAILRPTCGACMVGRGSRLGGVAAGLRCGMASSRLAGGGAGRGGGDRRLPVGTDANPARLADRGDPSQSSHPDRHRPRRGYLARGAARHPVRSAARPGWAAAGQVRAGPPAPGRPGGGRRRRPCADTQPGAPARRRRQPIPGRGTCSATPSSPGLAPPAMP